MTLSSLAEKVREQAYLVSLLEMWAEVEVQGFDPENVESFTFNPAFLTPDEKRQRRFVDGHWQPNPFTDGSRVKMFNAVRLKDGSLHRLNPMIKRR